MPCEPPQSLDMSGYPLFTLYPEEAAARIEARDNAMLSGIPHFSSVDEVLSGVDIQAVFPALPVVTEEITEYGDLNIRVTGLDAWGITEGMTYRGFVEDGSSRLSSNDSSPNSQPSGELLVQVPADQRDEWKKDARFQTSTYYISCRLNNYPMLECRDGAWRFVFDCGRDCSFTFSLGDEPKLLTCYYTHDGETERIFFDDNGQASTDEDDLFTFTTFQAVDGRTVDYCYEKNEGLDGIFVDSVIDDTHSIQARYEPDGQLDFIYVMGETVVRYDAEQDQWFVLDDEYEPVGTCDMPEGFQMEQWLTVPELVPEE